MMVHYGLMFASMYMHRYKCSGLRRIASPVTFGIFIAELGCFNLTHPMCAIYDPCAPKSILRTEVTGSIGPLLGNEFSINREFFLHSIHYCPPLGEEPGTANAPLPMFGRNRIKESLPWTAAACLTICLISKKCSLCIMGPLTLLGWSNKMVPISIFLLH